MWLWPPRSTELLHQGKHVVLGLAHPDDEVRAEPFCGPKISPRASGFPSISSQRVRRLHALAARALEDLRRRGVERDGEDVGAEFVQRLHVGRVIVVGLDRIDTGIVAGRCGRSSFSARSRVSASERGWVIMRDAHAVERAAVAVARDDVDRSARSGTAGQSTRMKLRSA